MTFNAEARERFQSFAASAEAAWSGNFRDLNGAIRRMATLAPGGRVDREVVEEEIERLRRSWRREEPAGDGEAELAGLIGAQAVEEMDRFDKVQLLDVLAACRRAGSLSEAGRVLFSASRKRKENPNDADRLRKYLARFALTWGQVTEAWGGRTAGRVSEK